MQVQLNNKIRYCYVFGQVTEIYSLLVSLVTAVLNYINLTVICIQMVKLKNSVTNQPRLIEHFWKVNIYIYNDSR